MSENTEFTVVEIFNPANKEHLKAFAHLQEHDVWPNKFLAGTSLMPTPTLIEKVQLLEAIAKHFINKEINESHKVILVIDADDDFALEYPGHEPSSYIKRVFNSPEECAEYLEKLTFIPIKENHQEHGEEWFEDYRHESLAFLKNFSPDGAVHRGGNWEWDLAACDGE